MNRDQRRQYKELAQALLQRQGINYDDWLADQHRMLVLDNTALIATALTKEMKSEKGE